MTESVAGSWRRTTPLSGSRHGAPLAVRAGVRALRWQWTKAAAEADLYDQALRLHLSEDFEESARSFVEKRPPVYRGR